MVFRYEASNHVVMRQFFSKVNSQKKQKNVLNPCLFEKRCEKYIPFEFWGGGGVVGGLLENCIIYSVDYFGSSSLYIFMSIPFSSSGKTSSHVLFSES